jgi:hypothetical protein
MLRTKLDEMIGGVMRFFETLMARVRRGPRAADEAADAAGDGRRVADAAEDARQPGGRDRTPDAERAEAVAIAKGITAANEKAGTPAAALDGILTGALKPRFGWIQGFDTPLVAPGHWRVIMRTPIDEEYKPGRYQRGDKVTVGRDTHQIKDVVIGPYTAERIGILDNGLILYRGRILSTRETALFKEQFLLRSRLKRGAISEAEFRNLWNRAYDAYKDIDPYKWGYPPKID